MPCDADAERAIERATGVDVSDIVDVNDIVDVRGVPVWESGPSSRYAVLSGEIEADVCVVGLGGSGLTCVRELLAAGASVVGVDAGRVGGGAAGRNGGFLLAGLADFYHDLVANVGRPRAAELYGLTVAEMERITAEVPELVHRCGSLRIAESDEELADCALHRDALRADGFAVDDYDGPEGRGLRIPGDGTFHPLARCRLLAEHAVREGATLHECSAALSIEAGVVRTAAGVARARAIVIAVDGGLEQIVPDLGDRVRTARLQMLATGPTSEVQLPYPVYANWGYDYWQQRPDGALVLGGARDLDMEREWTSDGTPTVVVQEALERRLRERIGVQAPITHRWAASVSYTTDGLPIVAEVRRGVWAIGGYSGTGNVVGPLLGRGVARLLTSGDDALLRPFIDGHAGARAHGHVGAHS